MGKAAVNAKEFINDIRAGMSDDELMRKHGLTGRQFRAVCQTLLDAGKLQPSDLEEPPPMRDLTFGVASTCRYCGAMKLADSGECPECGQATNVVTTSGQLDLDTFHETDTSTAAADDEGKREPLEVPDEIEPAPRISQSQPRVQSTEAPEPEAVATPVGGVFADKPAAPSAVRRLLVLAAAVTLPVVVILLASGWYLGVITLPFDQGADVVVAPARNAPVPALQAKKQQKIAPEKPALPPAATKQDSVPSTPPQTAKALTPTTPQHPAPKAGPIPGPAPVANSKPFQEVPAGASKQPDAPPPAPAEAATPQPAAEPKAVPAASPPDPKATPIAADLEKPRAAQASRAPEPARVATPQRPETLIAAVRKRDRNAVRQLLDEGADINAPDEDGVTPCMQAAVQGDAELVELLLQRGADVNRKDAMGSTALSLAIEGGNPRVVKALLARDRARGSVELIEASRSGRGDVVKVLLQGGANANAQDEQGNTLLMLAAGAGDLPLVKMLLERGADVNARNHQGVTALAWAYSSPLSEGVPLKARREIVRLLKQYGGKPGAPGSAQQ
ncbi:MAG: ankyrin repeat domain-containing protein [Desulfomonile sp.]|nr:ankyrin repeat domain-containing protein [Desulfomonile sp.]